LKMVGSSMGDVWKPFQRQAPAQGAPKQTDNKSDQDFTIPLTPSPSVQNVIAGFYNSLPLAAREMLPLPTLLAEFNKNGDAPGDGKRGAASWQEVSFIYAIPGEDVDEGLVVLADGSFRKYISCKGINALLFDEQDREAMAKRFADFANSCDSDIQII